MFYTIVLILALAAFSYVGYMIFSIPRKERETRKREDELGKKLGIKIRGDDNQ